MKRILFALALLGSSALAHAGLNIFACEPEWGALAQAIGGTKSRSTTPPPACKTGWV